MRIQTVSVGAYDVKKVDFIHGKRINEGRVASAKRVSLPNSLLLANKERCAQDMCRIPLFTVRQDGFGPRFD